MTLSSDTHSGQGRGRNQDLGQKRIYRKTGHFTTDHFIAPIVLTTKKDGSIKLTLNAKPINAQIWRNKYQMPNMHELIDSVAHIITKDVPGKIWFTSLDLKYAFSELPL